MQKTGKVHIYYGDGKGKTSIINGMIIRALGYHWNVKYIRFLKNWPTGEIMFFEEINHPNLEIFNCYSSSKKFFWDMNDQEKNILKQEVKTGFLLLKKLSLENNIDLLAVDELLGCIDNNLISEEDVIELIQNKNPNIELIFSGHNISKKLATAADLISNVKLIKHYYYQNVLARKGIEF